MLLAVDADLRRVTLRGTESLAGRSTGAVSTSDWDALRQHMHAILTTEGEVALFMGKRFQRHASDASSAGLDVQKTKSICDAPAAFRTATRNDAPQAGVAT